MIQIKTLTTSKIKTYHLTELDFLDRLMMTRSITVNSIF